jgi:hypothetical protein
MRSGRVGSKTRGILCHDAHAQYSLRIRISFMVVRARYTCKGMSETEASSEMAVCLSPMHGLSSTNFGRGLSQSRVEGGLPFLLLLLLFFSFLSPFLLVSVHSNFLSSFSSFLLVMTFTFSPSLLFSYIRHFPL